MQIFLLDNFVPYGDFVHGIVYGTSWRGSEGELVVVRTGPWVPPIFRVSGKKYPLCVVGLETARILRSRLSVGLKPGSIERMVNFDLRTLLEGRDMKQLGLDWSNPENGIESLPMLQNPPDIDLFEIEMEDIEATFENRNYVNGISFPDLTSSVIPDLFACGNDIFCTESGRDFIDRIGSPWLSFSPFQVLEDSC